MPPDATNSMPPLSTSVLNVVPDTTSVAPLPLMVVPVAVPPDWM